MYGLRTGPHPTMLPGRFGMEQALTEIFDQARALVTEVDRKIAEEQARQREKERETKLLQISARIEAAFDFTSKEKLELDPRLDLQDGTALVEFVVRSLRAIFFLAPKDDAQWTLKVLEEGRELQELGVFAGGSKTDHGSRRLAAARVVKAIGDWSQNVESPTKKASKSETPRWQNGGAKQEPTYGTMGKFLGY